MLLQVLGYYSAANSESIHFSANVAHFRHTYTDLSAVTTITGKRNRPSHARAVAHIRRFVVLMARATSRQ